MIDVPARAMVLAAGLGTRLRPITERMPKPLIVVNGRTLLDRALDHLVDIGVREAVVNLHWKGAMIRDHLRSRVKPAISFSDESDVLLETGGGIARALPLLGHEPFLSVNADAIWSNAGASALKRLCDAFDAQAMDALLLLVDVQRAGRSYKGRGDFSRAADGRLARRPPEGSAPFIYSGLQIVHPRLFESAPQGAFSLNILYDRAIAQGRLHGLVHDGLWLDVGTHEGLAEAERVFHD